MQAVTISPADLAEQLVRDRRHLHAHPELGFQEHETSRFVVDRLRTLDDLEIQTGIAGTGVVALLQAARPGPTLMLRADTAGRGDVRGADRTLPRACLII